MKVIPKCYRIWFKDGTAMLVDANSIADAKAKTLMPEDVRKVECLD